MDRERLDITKLRTVEDIDTVNYPDFFGDAHNDGVNGWVKFIQSPVSQRDLDRICELSTKSEKVKLGNNMGELFMGRRPRRSLDLVPYWADRMVTKVTKIDKCRGCPFQDIADSCDPVCTFAPNFADAPRRNLLKLSDVSDKRVKRSDNRVLCVFIPEERVFSVDKKPIWCKLEETSVTYRR